MKKIKNKILAIILVITFVLNFMLPVLIDTSVVLAADATDYDFRNELDADRVGIGFTWTAATRTLTITGIKNSNAEIKLPDNSTIDIQGSIENEIKTIVAAGSLTIKGNDAASLNIDRTVIGSESIRGIEVTDTLTIDGGIINITNMANNNQNNGSICTGIWAPNIIINNGNISVDAQRKGNYLTKAYALYTQKLIINDGKINAKSTDEAISLGSSSKKTLTEINGGDIHIESKEGKYAVTGGATINGGNVYALTTGSNPGWSFENVPSVNPLVEWEITCGYRKNDGTDFEKPADITDIYTACHNKLLKLTSKNNNDIPNNVHNATDYDFRNELGADRVGIGFTWTAATRTLTITGIKNSNAEIQLPENSTIDIQGNIENEIKTIVANGSLTIKGNNVASLNIDRTVIGSESIRGIEATDTLTIDSGIINITNMANNNENNGSICTGIWAPNIIMNNGNINVDAQRKGNYLTKAYALYTQKLIINDGKINAKSTDEAISLGSSSKKTLTEINGGDIHIESKEGKYAVTGGATINGGNVYALTTGSNPGWSFENVPSVNPVVNWTIFHGYRKNDGTDFEKPADITDIYNVCHSKLLKILSDVPATGMTEVTGENEIIVGERTTFIATLEPSYATSIVTWSSSNERVATVSENGEITGIGPGTTTITATANGFSASKDINVKCKITLDPSGVEGIDKSIVYTNIDGRVEELPTLSDNANIFNKWVDENGNEVTTDTIFSTNTTIYADWTAKPILVGEQKDIATYGETTNVNYDVTADFGGTYTVKVENLPEGVTLINDNISLDASENGKYIGTIKLSVSNMVNAGKITNLKMYVNNKHASNNFSLVVNKAESIFAQEPELKVVVFNGEEQEIIKAGSTNDGTILYSLDGVNFSDKIPTTMNVGKYKVYYRIVGDKNHLDSEIKSVESIITDLIGDINGDGKVNARDAKIVLQYFNGNIELTEEQRVKADVNGDGKINARDAKLILQIFNGK